MFVAAHDSERNAREFTAPWLFRCRNEATAGLPRWSAADGRYAVVCGKKSKRKWSFPAHNRIKAALGTTDACAGYLRYLLQ
jgi:hypothetical protein